MHSCYKIGSLRAKNFLAIDISGHHVVHLEDPHGFQLLPSSLFVCLSVVPLHSQVGGPFTAINFFCMCTLIGGVCGRHEIALGAEAQKTCDPLT